MELRFKNWTIFASRGVGAQQYDNLADVLLVSGDLPDGFQWTLLVGHEGLLDTVLLTEVSGSLRGTIPKDTLAYTGEYQLQLKGVSGELTKHTNVLRVMVPGSLSGDAQWPEVPSESTQVEERIRELNEHPPIPGDDGYWYINALESYIDFPAWDGLEKNPKYKKLRNKIDQQLSGYADSSVRKKYLWLKRKLNDIEFKASCY